MAFKPSERSKKQAWERQQKESAERRDSVTERLIAAYKAEDDRDYAEEFYGSMLRERGIDTSAL